MNSGFSGHRPPRHQGNGGRAGCLAAALAVLTALAALAPTALMAHDEHSVEIERLSAQIKAAPNDALLFLKRAEMHRLDRHWHAATPDYLRAAELDPQLAMVDLAHAAMWNDAGKPQRAVALLDRFIQREPNNPAGYAERARAHRALQQWTAALADYRRAIESNREPSPEDFSQWADACREAGEPTEALAVLQQGIERLGAISSLEMKALEIEQLAGLHDPALQRLDAMLERPGRKDSLLVRKAAILIAAGRNGQATAALELAQAELDSLPAGRRATAASTQLAAEIVRLQALLSDPPNKTTEPSE